MMSHTYDPKPIDTSDVQLDEDLVELASRLAVNAHENWARRRIDEGWSYGPRRDDVTKEHPSLAPYDDLPESEREYDRIMVTETIKGAIALGFTIAPKGG